jgi:hypothetical protein
VTAAQKEKRGVAKNIARESLIPLSPLYEGSHLHLHQFQIFLEWFERFVGDEELIVL